MAATATPRPAASTNKLGSYRCDGHRRELVTRRTKEGLEITDRPTKRDGEQYVVEPAVDDAGEARALADDYLALAETTGEIPMTRAAK